MTKKLYLEDVTAAGKSIEKAALKVFQAYIDHDASKIQIDNVEAALIQIIVAARNSKNLKCLNCSWIGTVNNLLPPRKSLPPSAIKKQGIRRVYFSRCPKCKGADIDTLDGGDGAAEPTQIATARQL